MLEVLAASLYDRWALWSCYRERAVRSVLAGGRVGGALLEEETVAWSVVAQEGEEHELVAVGIGRLNTAPTMLETGSREQRSPLWKRSH